MVSWFRTEKTAQTVSVAVDWVPAHVFIPPPVTAEEQMLLE